MTRILDINDNEIQEEDIDFEKGYLTPDKIFKEHHDAISEQERQWHYTVTTVYFEDGTKFEPKSENDPHIQTDDIHSGRFRYIAQEGEEPKEIRGMDLREIEDSPAIIAQEAWDEYEDIQRYKLYTQEELDQREAEKIAKEKKEELLSTGLDRIKGLEATNETHIEKIEATNKSIDDLILLMADIIGGEKIEEEKELEE